MYEVEDVKRTDERTDSISLKQKIKNKLNKNKLKEKELNEDFIEYNIFLNIILDN